MFGFGLPEMIVLVCMLAPFVLWLAALVDIIKSEFNGNNKIIWLLVVLLLPLLGAILYFFVGRKQKVNPALAAVDESKERFCGDCGKSINPRAEICPNCGVRQQPVRSSGRNPLAIILIVVVVGLGCVAGIGILAAIAIPQFSAYRVKAYDSAAKSDVMNAKTSLESYYADHQKYPSSLDEANFHPSQNVEVTYEKTGKGRYVIISAHKDGRNQFATTSDGAEVKWRSKDAPNSEFVSQ